MMNIKEILGKMTLEEKISFCTGADFWRTKGFEKYGIPQIMMCDGPHGLRCQKGATDMIGINESIPATCFPTAVTAGATWNTDLFFKEGEAIAKEASDADVSIVLGPGCNIKRNPLGGRNFEYLSEDPYIAGKMAAAFIRGAESVGIGTSLKHFAVNNQEYKRMNGDSRLDERALREIYLAPFETAVKEGKPATVMCSYNKINGVHASDSKMLLSDILRDEWGFDGTVISDWGALNDRIEGFIAGCDLNMPGGSKFMEKATLKAVQEGKLSEDLIDQACERILKLVLKGNEIKHANSDLEEHHILAKQIATEGAVLLKNDDNLLPTAEEDAVLIGYMAKNLRYQGSGSSHINPTKLVNIADAMGETPVYACGDKFGNVSEEEIICAKETARQRNVAIVTVGLPESYESEAFDREHMRLPDGHIALVNAVADENPNTVVVLLGGSAMELPFADKVKAILYAGLPGQAGGEAIADVLLGRAVPSGKLTESWPISYADVISRETFGARDPEYRESIYVGYRYYDSARLDVAFPFGYGLSYANFEYSDLAIDKKSELDYEVSFTVKNTSNVDGKEICQLYVRDPFSYVSRPLQELRGFDKVALKAGESCRVTISLNKRSFAYYSPNLHDWFVENGDFEIMVGASSRDIRLAGKLCIKLPEEEQFTL